MITPTCERPAQALTCANCPYFQNFGEASGRGWCGVFDCIARAHHERTASCEQEIESLEKAQQQLSLQQQPVGLARDSASYQLQATQEAQTEFEQGRCHGQQDAAAKLHPMYTQPASEYAAGYILGYNSIFYPQQAEITKSSVEWSVIYNPTWNWYEVWVGKRCCLEKASSYEEGERIAQKYIAAAQFWHEHRQKVMAAYAC